MKPELATQPESKQEKQINKWQEYERLKKEIPSTLTGSEYQAECTRIARELGI